MHASPLAGATAAFGALALLAVAMHQRGDAASAPAATASLRATTRDALGQSATSLGPQWTKNLTVDGGADPLTYWIPSASAGGVVCSSAAAECHAFAHFKIAVRVEDAGAARVTGGGSYSLDNGATWIAGAALTSERHVVSGACACGSDDDCDASSTDCVDFGGDALLFAWSWSAQAPLASAASLPSSVCVAAWAHDAASGAIAASEVTCVDVGTSSTIIAGRGNTASYIADKRSSQLVVPEYNSFASAATRVCSTTGRKCRTSMHVAFSAASDMALDTLNAGGEVSFDGGEHWSSARTNVADEGRLELAADGVWYKPLQFTYEHVSDETDGTTPTEVCFKAWVEDTQTSELVWLASAHEDLSRTCMTICNTTAAYHNADGYCSSS